MNYPINSVMNSVPAAKELRKVAGFNPAKFLRQTVSERTGEKVLKLDLPYKRLWFRLACPNGRMVIKPLQVNDQLAVFEAMVYAEKSDPEPLARFTSSVSAQDALGGKFVQAAQEAALDEALENAGFGIQLCDIVEGAGTARFGSEIPLDSVVTARRAEPSAQTQKAAQPVSAPEQKMATPVTAPPVTVHTEAKHVEKAVIPAAPPAEAPAVQQPAAAPAAPEQEAGMDAVNELLGKRPAVVTDFPVPAPAAQTKEAVPTDAEAPAVTVADAAAAPVEEPAAPSYTPDMSVEEICERMTLDEAKNYVVNSGVCKGWTLAQVAERRAPSLRFYVYSDNGDNVLKAAATLVLNDMGMRKAE